jgi:hypothetical protein
MKIKIAFALIALVIMACVCGGTAPTSSGSPNSSSGTPAQGSTRDNPISMGTAADIGQYMSAIVINVTRPADSQVAKGNMFNSTPEANLEYMIVELQIKCTASANEKCSPILTMFKAVGADGIVHETAYVAGIPNELDTNGELFGGSTVKGNLTYLVPKGDSSVVLFTEQIFGKTIYMSLK